MPTYRTIHTAYWLAAMASAEATGAPINPTHMPYIDSEKFVAGLVGLWVI